MTIRWKLRVLQKDGLESWIPLKLMKNVYPTETAEFRQAMGIDNKSAFFRWTLHYLRKCDRMIATIKKRVLKTTHKYGIKVPTLVVHTKEIDCQNKNTMQQNAINKEISNVYFAFEIRNAHQPIPVGWIKASGYVIFEVKMDFTRKARQIKDRHRTPKPMKSAYVGIVSRESVRITLTYAALNKLDVMVADIINAYLQALLSEKHYIICRPEFGLENVGKVTLIRRALYRDKSSGSNFWRYLRSFMTFLRYKSCPADPDIWIKEAQKDDGTKYWQFILLYVDNVLVVSYQPAHVILNDIGKYFVIKKGSIGVPKIYLENKVLQAIFSNGAEAWLFSSYQYVKD